MRHILNNVSRLPSDGFTLIETLVIVPTLALVVTALVAYMVGLLNSYSAGLTKDMAMYDTQAAFDTVEGDIGITKTFLQTIDSNMSDPYGSDGSGGTWDSNNTTYNNTANSVILRMFATSADVHNSSKTPIYINQYGCDPSVINNNPALTVDVIYFVQNGNLYRRTLVPATTTDPNTISTPSNVTTCTTPYQQQSCPAGASNAICKGTDKLLLSNVTDFAVAYTPPSEVAINPCHMPYRVACQSASPSYSPFTQTDLDTATSIRFYVSTSQPSTSGTSIYTTIYEYTKLND